MEFSALLEKRRSVRDYEDKPVPLDLIKEVINDAIKAPNAGNMQLWRFVIVINKDFMKRISDSNKKHFLADIEANENSPWAVYQNMFKKEDYNVFYNAPAVVYVVGTSKSATTPLDCSALASYFMLAAAERGLGTCWVAQGAEIKDPDLRAELGVPDNYRIVAPIAIGWPKSIPSMPPRKEPKILNVVE